MPESFAQLGVPESIITALARRGITEPFDIQAATIADALAGKDVCGRAPTGSGKTLAFGIPLVVRAGRAEPRRPRALVLAPTRELAEQIAGELRTFSGKTTVAVVYGGVGYGQQIKALQRGADILVACPGRLEDLIERGNVSLKQVNQVVLDEADRMADMGFMPAVRRLLDATPEDRQTVLFSATLDGDIAKLTERYQNKPVRHEIGPATTDITVATHLFWTLDKTERANTTALAVGAMWPAIVFTRTRHGADRLTKQLSREGVEAAAIHGGRSQNQRTRALERFSDGRVQALIATDVAARGIHVDDVAIVVHYDPPEDHKAYVHRSGRTARAGRGGVVLSLLLSDQVRDANSLQRRLKLDEPITSPDIERLRSMPAPSVGHTAPPKAKESPAAKPASSSPPRKKRTQGRTDRPRKGSRPPRKSTRDDGPSPSAAPDNDVVPRPNRKARRAHLQKDYVAGQESTDTATSHPSHPPQPPSRAERRAHLQKPPAR